MTTRVKLVAVSLVTFVAGACSDALSAKNYNNPDVQRVFQQPASIEQTLGTGYQQCRNTEKGGGNMRRRHDRPDGDHGARELLTAR